MVSYWTMQVKVNGEWKDVHPSGWKSPYTYATESEARLMLNICYPDCTPDVVRVHEAGTP